MPSFSAASNRPAYLRQVVYVKNGFVIESSWVEASVLARDNQWELDSALARKWADLISGQIEIASSAYVVDTPSECVVIPTREVIRVAVLQALEDLG